MEAYWIIIAPLVAALAAPWLVRMAGVRWTGAVLSIVPFLLAGWLVAGAREGASAIEWSQPWLPALQIELALRIGGFERFFLFLVSFIGGLILVFAGAYLKGDRNAGRLYLIILLFMMSMFGVVAADDMVLLFVFWELTSLTSFLLIGYKHTDKKARQAALQALLITGAGGLALLAGFILLAGIAGEWRLSALSGHAEAIVESPLFGTIVVLVLLGAFTKSAQAPFHFWLPGAMVAPTPVSAYLHSATMVKAGVILLAKLTPTFAAAPLWKWLLISFGGATMLLGALMAVVQIDLKRLLAYATVSVLGALVMLLGFGDAFSFKTAMYLALAHAFYKGALFMVAGTLDHTTGTRDVRALSGLRKSMPWLALAAMTAALSMSGVPPTLGFLSKELLYEAKLDQPVARFFVTVPSVLAFSLNVTIALIVGVRPFLGTKGETPVRHSPAFGLVAPPLLLALLGFGLGMMPGWLDRNWISPAVESIGLNPAEKLLTLWHGFTPVLALSLLTLLVGVGCFFVRNRLRLSPEASERFCRVGPEMIYQSSYDGMLRGAAWLTGWIQNGQLRLYLRVILVSAAAMLFYALVLVRGKITFGPTAPVGVFEMMVVVLMCASAIAALRASSRLGAILCLSGVGYSVALIFASHGAPDLAITQMLVETLTVVLFAFVVLKLPQIRRIAPRSERVWDGVAASMAGLAMMLVVWKSVHVQVHDSISPGLVERSFTEAHGRNVVNVILIDFRALDTMGEIVVLSLACLGVTALMFRKRDLGFPDHDLSEHDKAHSPEDRIHKK